MNIFHRPTRPDINTNIHEYQQHPDSLLIDTRTPQEYAAGHIPNAINLPLTQIHQAATQLKNKNQHLYLYCQSGTRSQQATNILQQMGYTNTKNIGGINNWKGPITRQ